MVNFMLKKIITIALVLATVLSLSSCGEQQQPVVSADNLGEIDITGEEQAELHYANYLLLNLALQPQNVGDADDSQFPITYQVDYVRVFQKK